MAYEKATEKYRQPSTALFRGISPLHNPVTLATLARWLSATLSSAGVDTFVFSPHSTRGASCSKAATVGFLIQSIMQTADWSSARNFRRFDHHPGGEPGSTAQEASFHSSVLAVGRSPAHCTAYVWLQSRVVMCEQEPSDIQWWNGSVHEVCASYSRLYEEGEGEHVTISHPAHPLSTCPSFVQVRQSVMGDHGTET